MSRVRHGEIADVRLLLADRLRLEREFLVEQVLGELGGLGQPPAGFAPVLPRVLTEAVDFFASWLVDPSAPRNGLDDHFRLIGVVQARSGQALDELRGGYQAATAAVWRRLREVATELGVPASGLGEWAAAAFEFVESLSEQSVHGYRQVAESPVQWHRQLLEAVLCPDRHPAWLLGRLAVATGWRVPQQVVAVAVQPTAGTPLPSADRLPPGALSDLSRRTPLLLLPAPLGADARSALAAVFAGHTIAIGCPVRLVDAAASVRWADRCLELVRSGVLGQRPVLDCAEHRALLWLHAEPLLRQQLGHSVLAPLLRQAPHTRRILAETMLAWLETRGSAPALAARLGKHAQTVRYRLRRLHQIFGSDLEDAERCFEIYLVLRASMPLWSGEAGEDLVPAAAEYGLPQRLAAGAVEERTTSSGS